MQLYKFLPMLLLALTFVINVPVPIVWSADPKYPSAATLMSDQVQGFVRIGNLPQFVDRWNSTQLGILAQDQSLADFWREQRQEIEKRFSEAGWELNIHPEDVYEIASGQVALGWMRVKNVNKPYSVAIIVDIDGRDQEAEKLLKRIDDEFVARKAKADKVVYSDQSISQYILRRPGETTETKAYYSLVSGQLFASDDLDTIKGIIDSKMNSSSQSLAASDLYKTSRSHLKTRQAVQEIEYFVRPFGLAHVLRGISKKQKKTQTDILQILENQGFDKLAAISGNIEIADKEFDIFHQSFVQTLPPLPASVQILDFPNAANKDIPNWVGPNASTFMSLAWNVKEAFWRVEGIFDEAVGGKGSFKDMIASIRTDSHGPQIDIEREVLPFLTSEIYATSSCIQPITPSSRRSLIAVRVIEPAKMVLLLDRFMKTEPDVEAIEHDGHRIWKKSKQEEVDPTAIDLDFANGFPGQAKKNEKKKPVENESEKEWLSTWAVTIHSDYLMFASNEEVIKEAIQNEVNPNQANKLGQEPDVARVQAAIASLTKEINSNCVWHVNRADRSFEMQYELFRQDQLPQSQSMLASILDRLLNPKNEVREKNQRVKGGKLPPFSEIRKYFMPGGTVVETLPDGWLIHSFLLSSVVSTADASNATAQQAAKESQSR